MKDKYYLEYRRLGLSIAYFRKYGGKTQQDLADILDVNYETVSRIENANAGASLDMLFGISEALNVPPQRNFRPRQGVARAKNHRRVSISFDKPCHRMVK